MRNLATFLVKLRNDVFKILPMKEAANEGEDNHLGDYIYSLIITSEGALSTYSRLSTEKPYIYVINNLNYLHNHPDLSLTNWRKVILNSTRGLNDLYLKYEQEEQSNERN